MWKKLCILFSLAFFLFLVQWLIFIRGHRDQNSGGSRLVADLESAVAARISRCNYNQSQLESWSFFKLLQASSRFLKQQAEPESVVTEIRRQKTNHKKWCILQSKSLNLLDILKYKTVASRFQPAELESAATRSQLQDGISCNSHRAARTRVSCRMESALSRIQPSELEPAVGCSQL